MRSRSMGTSNSAAAGGPVILVNLPVLLVARVMLVAPVLLIVLALLGAATVARASMEVDQGGDGEAVMRDGQARAPKTYVVHLLESDGLIPADHTDPNLLNGWGIAAGATGPWWVADNHSDKSTLYSADGTALPLIVTVPGGPTGIVFNGTASFSITDGTTSAPAFFLFATEGGRILGWAPTVPAGSTQTQLGVDRSGAGAIYKGLAIASTDAGDRIYATDFHNGVVDVFDGTFTQVVNPDAFVDRKIPAGFAPFGIQNVEGRIYVTYAKQDDDREDDVAGKGLGYVSVFETDGTFVGRIASKGKLDAPWGIALAPSDFGAASGTLLVGNFGDGKINAFKIAANGKHGASMGQLKGENKKPIVVDGLWGIAFGNGATAGPTNTLFFAAGPLDEEHGVFGSITASEAP